MDLTWSNSMCFRSIGIRSLCQNCCLNTSCFQKPPRSLLTDQLWVPPRVSGSKAYIFFSKCSRSHWGVWFPLGVRRSPKVSKGLQRSPKVSKGLQRSQYCRSIVVHNTVLSALAAADSWHFGGSSCHFAHSIMDLGKMARSHGSISGRCRRCHWDKVVTLLRYLFHIFLYVFCWVAASKRGLSWSTIVFARVGRVGRVAPVVEAISYSGVISACNEASQWEQALYFLQFSRCPLHIRCHPKYYCWNAVASFLSLTFVTPSSLPGSVNELILWLSPSVLWPAKKRPHGNQRCNFFATSKFCGWKPTSSHMVRCF